MPLPPGEAEILYLEPVAPYQPVPAILAVRFEDFARLHLELRAWERIRDARFDHRCQQADIERRRRFRDVQRDLMATT